MTAPFASSSLSAVSMTAAQAADGISRKTLTPGLQVTITDTPFNQAILTVGTDGTFVSIPNGYISATDNMPTSLSSGVGKQFTNVAYIDPVNGDDVANSGYSAASPKKTFNSNNAWAGTSGFQNFSPSMCALFKTGTTYSETQTNGISLSGNQGIGSYGDLSLSKPVLKSNYTGSNAAVVKVGAPDGAMVADVIIDGLGYTDRHGLYVFTFGAGAGNPFKDLLIRGVDVKNIRQTASTDPVAIANGTANANWFAGIQLNRSASAGTNTGFSRGNNVRVENCTVTNMGGHGISMIGAIGTIQSNGFWGGFDIVKCTVNDYGRDIDSHGITAYGTSIAGWAGGTWTQVSGTVYSIDLSVKLGRQTDNVEYATVYLGAIPRGYILTQYVGTPGGGWANLPLQYFGFDPATQLFYVNYGSAPVGTDSFQTSSNTPRGIRYIECVTQGCDTMKLNTKYREGHGLVFDDMVSDGFMIGSKSLNAGGAGVSSNRGFNNTIRRCQIINAQNGQIGMGLGIGHLLEQNLIVGGTPVARSAGNNGLVNFDSFYSTFNSLIPQARLRSNILHATGNLDGWVGTGTGYFQMPILLDGNTFTKQTNVTVSDLGYGKHIGR